MTENEAIERIKTGICCEKGTARYCTDACMYGKEKCAYSVAIKALEEIQRWHTSVVNPNVKNEFANRSTQICHNCDHKDEYIEELEAEVEAFRAIGTVEECRAAMGRWIDADAVMKQLEEHFNATNDKGARLAYHHAIKIVKGGGVDG